jgi:hypothetical protein
MFDHAATRTQWTREMQSMRDVNFTFVIIPHTGRQRDGPSAECPYGTFETYYPVAPSAFNGTGAKCYTEIGRVPNNGIGANNVTAGGGGGGGVLGTIIAAAKAAGIPNGVHLGLMFASAEHGFPSQNRNGSYQSWGHYQASVASELVGQYGASVTGVYTEIEFSNSEGWMDVMPAFGHDYLGAIARGVATLPGGPGIRVWASPYSIGNLTRHPTGYTSPAGYAAGLRVAVDAAGGPTLFHGVAMQDSMGAQGNSFENASAFLGNISVAVPASVWANVEVFEVWPANCSWPDPCHGRHPAPWSRIALQMANEAAVLGGGAAATLIAWEWYSCFSPNAAEDPGHRFPAEAKANYEAYAQYLKGTAAAQQ